ncbi:hypothetical protein IAR55_006808 [Kwoniella newhampshirensis]|uniref:Uncharacterized protein n=1 Tax=Kwoniella newhampshirensis TaxID=1651941 RepID=A0AAW0YTC2_9TREE
MNGAPCDTLLLLPIHRSNITFAFDIPYDTAAHPHISGIDCYPAMSTSMHTQLRDDHARRNRDIEITYDSSSTLDQDAVQLANLGYKSALARRWGQAESFAAAFCAMNFIACVRSYIFLGISAGGPAAVW